MKKGGNEKLTSPRRTLDVVTSSIETPDGVRALEVPKSDAGSSQDEAPVKDKTVNTL